MLSCTLEVALNAIAKSRIDPGHADQDKAQHNEGQDAIHSLQFAQIVEKKLEHADHEQCQAGEALYAIAQGEAAAKQQQRLQTPDHGQHSARDFVEEQNSE